MSACLKVRSAVVTLRRTCLSVFEQRSKLAVNYLRVSLLSARVVFKLFFQVGTYYLLLVGKSHFRRVFFFFPSLSSVCVFVDVSNCISSYCSFFPHSSFHHLLLPILSSPFSLLFPFFLSFFLSSFLSWSSETLGVWENDKSWKVNKAVHHRFRLSLRRWRFNEKFFRQKLFFVKLYTK